MGCLRHGFAVLLATAIYIGIIAISVTSASEQCVGDCDEDRQVTISELITGVNIALGNAQVESCAEFDANDDSEVTISELIAAVNNALSGCTTEPVGSPLPTATRTVGARTPTPTPTWTPTVTVAPPATATLSATPSHTWTPTVTQTTVPEPCTPGSCNEGLACWDGRCVPDAGEGPGDGPGPNCTLPQLICEGTEAYCGELIQFDPVEGDGYIDYPENGETWDNQYRSWLRRDVVMMIQYAAAYVACKAENWTFGNGGPVGLIDMSEQDGSIPGTSIGQPGHPYGTHTDGKDIDVAYFQVSTSNNKARAVCKHHEWYGSDAYHCTEYPHLLDPWRQALFIGAIFEHPALRVVGCDGKAGPMIDYAFEYLCDHNWLSEDACETSKLTYEETDQGRGWFYFHHHHTHVSFTPPDYDAKGRAAVDDNSKCLVPGCDPEPLRLYLEKVM